MKRLWVKQMKKCPHCNKANKIVEINREKACKYCFKAPYSDEYSADFESAYKEILEYIKEEGYINAAGDNDVENYDVDLYPQFYCSQKIETQEHLKNQTWGDVKIGDTCGGFTSIDEKNCSECGRANQLEDRVIMEWKETDTM